MLEKDIMQDTEDRKKKIKKLLMEPAKGRAVVIEERSGTKKVVSEKAYRIICLNGLLQPKALLELYGDDQYNNGPWLETEELTVFTPKQKKQLSLLDKMRILIKEKKIERIKTAKNPLFDKKGEVTIKLFPVSHKETGRPLSKMPEFQRKYISPEETDRLIVVATPRELAIAGIDYKEVGWKEIIKQKPQNPKESNKFLEYIKVDESPSNSNESRSNSSELNKNRDEEQVR